MKYILSFFLCVAFTLSVSAEKVDHWSKAVSHDPAVQTLTPDMLQHGLDEFLNLTPKKYREMTGKRLGLKKSIQLKAAQKVVKQKLKKDGLGDGDSKSQIVALLLCWFLGALGIHRLYLGYKNWWLMLITLGGCGIWALIDLIRIAIGDMKPADGSDYDPSF